MSDLRKAILFSVLNQHSLQVISIVSIAILARLLSPDEIGIFSVATSIAFLATELRSFGVSEYLIREKEINTGKIRTVLGVMVIMSWGLAILLIGGAPWFAHFYDNPELRNLLWIISLPFFLAPHTAVPYALLVRDMKFTAILRINLLGSTRTSDKDELRRSIDGILARRQEGVPWIAVTSNAGGGHGGSPGDWD